MGFYRRRLKFYKKAATAVIIVSFSLVVLSQVLKMSYQSTKDQPIKIDPPLTKLESVSGIDFNIERQFSFGKTNTDDVSIMHNGIPKRLHFIWTDTMIPSVFMENLNSFRVNNPDWIIYLWTFEIGRYLISRKEPQLLATFDEYTLRVIKADSIKYVIMFHFGGAYFDLDTRSIKPLDPLVHGRECLLSPEAKENAIVHLHRNSVMASSIFICRARHPLFRYFIDQLPFYSDTKNIMVAAGPLFVTWNIASFIRRQGNTSGIIKYRDHDTFSFSTISSEIFEDHILEETLVRFAQVCVRNTKNRLTRIENTRIKHKEQQYQYVDAWIEIVKLACVHWQSRNAFLRKLSPNAYTKHEHFGTYLPKNRQLIGDSEKLKIQSIVQNVKVLTTKEVDVMQS